MADALLARVLRGRLLPGFFAAAIVCSLAFPATAFACAACNAGDEPISAVGEELLADRGGRLALQLRGWGERAHGQDQPEGMGLQELRLDLTAALRPAPGLAVAIAVPLQLRQVSMFGAREQVAGLGDADLSARLVTWSADDGAHVLSVLGGLELPTAPAQGWEEGAPLDLDLQLGTGSVDPRAGVAWAWRLDALTLTSQLCVRTPLEGWDRYRVGPSARAELAATAQPLRWVGFRLGVEGRVHTTDFHRGYTVHDSAGAILSLQAGVLFRPWPKDTVLLQAFVPVTATGSRTVELPVVTAGFAHDL